MKIYVEAYGCTANKSDANLVKGVLKQNHYQITDKIDQAETIVIHTCTVIDTTEQRMLSRLKQIKKHGKTVIVAGCMASIQAEKIKKILPTAKLLPPQHSHNIINVLKDKKPCFTEENKTVFPKYYDDIFAPISIAEGCLFSCSYCITSLARGKLRSFPASGIKKDINMAIEQGCKEIQLTAQDTSSYDLDSNSNLGLLLQNITTIRKDFRVRVGMMNPFTCLKHLDQILEGFNDPQIYRFIHVPVQSGDNIILKKMNRKYTVDDFYNIINKFREKYPDITIATDIIVGFPGETDEQFKNTIILLKKIRPDITNITRFSARPYTKAKNMKGRIKTEIVKQRSKQLTQICSRISKENNTRYIGEKYTVLITEKGKNNTMVGRSENYKPVVIRETKEIGSYVNVEITAAAPTYLVGSII
jgi:MiaB-like tRNA modifying enzyme